MKPPECIELDDHLEELVAGDLAEPMRGRLLAHAATCRQCRTQLDELLALTDALLQFAPHHEPPAGFEARVLESVGGAAQRASGRPARRLWIGLGIAGAAAVLLALVAGLVIGRHGADAVDSVERSGVIAAADGSRVGSIQLVRSDQPYAVITIEHPRPGDRTVRCDLVLDDGRVVTVGTWGYADVNRHVWAAGLDDEMLSATAMRIVDEDGSILAGVALE